MQYRPPRWWQTGVVDEIYPRSFADDSGNGTGDLAGITSRLDTLAWLGVDAIWIATARMPSDACRPTVIWPSSSA